MFLELVFLKKITYTIFGAPEGASYIHAYGKGRENNSNTRGN